MPGGHRLSLQKSNATTPQNSFNFRATPTSPSALETAVNPLHSPLWASCLSITVIPSPPDEGKWEGQGDSVLQEQPSTNEQIGTDPSVLFPLGWDNSEEAAPIA